MLYMEKLFFFHTRCCYAPRKAFLTVTVVDKWPCFFPCSFISTATVLQQGSSIPPTLVAVVLYSTLSRPGLLVQQCGTVWNVEHIQLTFGHLSYTWIWTSDHDQIWAIWVKPAHQATLYLELYFLLWPMQLFRKDTARATWSVINQVCPV